MMCSSGGFWAGFFPEDGHLGNGLITIHQDLFHCRSPQRFVHLHGDVLRRHILQGIDMKPESSAFRELPCALFSPFVFSFIPSEIPPNTHYGEKTKPKRTIYDTRDVVLMEEHAKDEDTKLVLIQKPVFLHKLVPHTFEPFDAAHVNTPPNAQHGSKGTSIHFLCVFRLGKNQFILLLNVPIIILISCF